MFFLTGVAKFLFVPMAEAVVFAMLASYLLSRTLVPTLVMYMMRGYQHRTEAANDYFGRFQQGFDRRFERFRLGYRSMLQAVLVHRGAFATGFLLFCILSLGLVFFLGTDFFPAVDAGLLRLHLRARSGLRVEETARLCDYFEQELRRHFPPGELETVLDNIGVPYSGMNLSYSNSGVIGSSDAEMLISLNPEHHAPTATTFGSCVRSCRGVSPEWSFSFSPPTSLLKF